MGTTPYDVIKTPRPLTKRVVSAVQRATGLKPSRRAAIEWLVDYFERTEKEATK
jgi:hypothetical protein